MCGSPLHPQNYKQSVSIEIVVVLVEEAAMVTEVIMVAVVDTVGATMVIIVKLKETTITMVITTISIKYQANQQQSQVQFQQPMQHTPTQLDVPPSSR